MKNIPRCHDDAREKEFVDIVKIKSEKAPHAFARGERESESERELSSAKHYRCQILMVQGQHMIFIIMLACVS